VLDVGELHLQAVGAAAAVAEVDLAESFPSEGTQLLLTGASILGVEEAGRVLRGQTEGEVTDTGIVGGTGRGGESEAGTGVEDESGAGGGLTAGALTECSAKQRGPDHLLGVMPYTG
jgi:hypothetical protein